MELKEYEPSFIVSCIKAVIRARSKTNPLMNALDMSDNPFKGMCYVASALFYEIYEGKNISLYKKKDFKNQYHWWIRTDDGMTIDITEEQYLIEGREVPSASYEDAILSKPMWFPSYKKRMLLLKEELVKYIASMDVV